ncbi:MAG: hypothetical protein DRP78_06560 [Candidatus Omnitrophota bacterium]|nr:MAG: hypothetical protein DRP78_06560 [Candidatus Omnitrophota bacterium]
MNKKMIKYSRRPRLKSPYLIAVWPGMGNIAIRAGEFLWNELKPKQFAELIPEGFFYPHEAWVINNQIEVPRLPVGRFYYWQNPSGSHDLILFICEAQPVMEKGYNYAQLVLDVASEFKVKRVFTFAAMPVPIDHMQKSKIWGTATNKKLIREMALFGIKPMHVGQISGMNGLLLAVAKQRHLDGFCFLAEIPLYAIQIENPKASKAVLKVLSKILGLKFDFTSLEERSKIIEEEIEKLVGYFKAGTMPGPISEEEVEHIKKTLALITKLPKSVTKRIEDLFKAAEKDISKAAQLKDELDKWHIYKDYEDRFLDLFGQGKKKKK